MGEKFKEMISFVRAAVYRAEVRRRRKREISENEALEKGLKEKSAEFAKAGDVYQKV